MRVLVIDVGGTHVKLLATGQQTHRQFSSGPKMTAKQMVSGVKKVVGDWDYDAISLGYPGPVLHGRPVAEPDNLGGGWVGFHFQEAFQHPVKVVNDAAMQALGSYRGDGKMLFLGLGTGSDPHWCWMAKSNPWNWVIFRTGRRPSKTISDCAV